MLLNSKAEQSLQLCVPLSLEREGVKGIRLNVRTQRDWHTVKELSVIHTHKIDNNIERYNEENTWE